MKNFIPLLFFLFTIPITYSQTTVFKGFNFEIDADHDKRTNEWTKNKITVKFNYYWNNRYYSQSKSLNGISEFKVHEQSLSTVFTSDKAIVFEGPRRSSKSESLRIVSIEVSTNGDDGFMIDAAKLTWYKESKTKSDNGWKVIGNALKNGVKNTVQKGTTKKWGVNGKGAWCLSTDPKDANGKWKGVVSKCYKRIVFDVRTGKASGHYN